MSGWRPLVEVLGTVEEHAGPEWMARDASSQSPNPAAAQHLAAHADRPGAHAGPSDAGPMGHGGSNGHDGAPESGHAETELVRRAAYDEGMALARQEGEALALRYRAAIENLVQTRESMRQGCEADLVRLSLTIAREVLMADVPGREQFTQRMVEHALTLLGDGEPMTLRLSPQDLLAMRQHKPELLRRPGVTWQEDDALSMGGVIAEGARGRLDASIVARLEAMAQQLGVQARGTGS